MAKTSSSPNMILPYRIGFLKSFKQNCLYLFSPKTSSKQVWENKIVWASRKQHLPKNMKWASTILAWLFKKIVFYDYWKIKEYFLAQRIVKRKFFTTIKKIFCEIWQIFYRENCWYTATKTFDIVLTTIL